MDILSTGMIASTRIRKLIALSVRRPPFLMISSAAMSLFTLAAPSLSPSKMLTNNRAWESVLESLFWSCQVLYRRLATLSIVPLPRRLSTTLCLQLPSWRHSQSLTSSPPSDKTGAKSLTSPRSFSTLLLQVGRACKVVGMERFRSESTCCHSSATKGEGEGGEGWPWLRRYYAWFFWKRNLLIDNHLFLGPG